MSFKQLTRNLPLTLNTKQLNKLRKHCATTGLAFNENQISDVYSFWLENMSIVTHYDRNHKPINPTQIINKVLLNEAPDLMFINIDVMKKRLEKFFQFGFINNVDKLHLFHESPYGWYLQDWEQFSIKFNYIQFRIIPWLMKSEDDPFPDPHPLVRACKALELPYDTIKARFLWVKSAGIAPPKLNEDDGDRLINPSKVLRNLLLTNVNYFVKSTTPGATPNEYEFFEKMIGQTEMIEDSIMSRLNDLTPAEENDLLKNHEDENIREIASLEFKRIK